MIPAACGQSRFNMAVPFALAILTLVARWVILWQTHSTTEDFLITLRYAENVASGRGFVYNPGEHVLGTTTPLYTLLLAGASLLHLDPTRFGKALNILAEGATVLLICRVADHIGHRRAGWVAGLLYATMSAPISISIGGMETALVTCAGMAAICGYVERRPNVFAISSALLFLLRIDGLLLTTILAIAWLFRQRGQPIEPAQRLGARSGLLFAVLILPWIVFATLYFGSPVPASMLAKMAVYARTRAGTLPNLGDFRVQFAAGAQQLAILLCAIVGAVYGWTRKRNLRVVLIWMVAYYAAMLASPVPAFAWYFLPPWPVYCLCVGLGVASMMRPLTWNLRERWIIVGLAIAALPLIWHLGAVRRDIESAQWLEDKTRRPLGEWLAANGRAGDTVMLEPIGYIGYYSGARVLDMIGLVSPEVIPCYRRDLPEPIACIVDRFHPDWLVLRPGERRLLDPGAEPPGKEGSKPLHGEYRWVRSAPDNAAVPAFEVYKRMSVGR